MTVGLENRFTHEFEFEHDSEVIDKIMVDGLVTTISKAVLENKSRFLQYDHKYTGNLGVSSYTLSVEIFPRNFYHRLQRILQDHKIPDEEIKSIIKGIATI